MAPTVTSTFDLVDPALDGHDQAARRQAFESQVAPATLGNHRAAAPFFEATPKLVTAVNAALAVGAPLLLTGEPGTGKTQVAYWVAWNLGIEDRVFPLVVQSSTTESDLTYKFDTVRYFHAAQDPARREDPDLKGKPLDKHEFIDARPLWKAFASEKRSIVLIDEIDKASRDFPNDLLHCLDQREFAVREVGETRRPLPGVPPPFVVITSNSERQLPEPFLRRCIFHHIKFDEKLVATVVEKRRGEFPSLYGDNALREAALERFLALRRRKDLKKPPSLAELLVWLTLLDTSKKLDVATLRDAPDRELPALAALIKTREDLDRL